jgi:O-succinylbenzoate synthase
VNIEQVARECGPVTLGLIEAWRVAIPMTEPFRISSGEVASKDAIVVRVSHAGAFGWGESSAMAGAFYSADTPDSCERELVERVLTAMAGRTFADMLALEAELAALTASRFVRVAVETAAWELLARARGVSVRRLFGIPDRPAPSGLAIGLYDTLDGLRAALDRYDPRQYCRLKIKIKRGQDVELVRAVREWLGDFPLFVDANADYSLADIETFRELDRYGLMMLEQPLARAAVEDSAAMQRQLATPICFDEGVESLADARRARELDACRIVNIKLQRVGGYLEAMRIVEYCAAEGVPLWMGTMPELGVGSAQALAIAAHPGFVFPTDVEPSARWYTDDLLFPELALRDRALHAPEGPGIGYTVDEKKLARYAVRSWRFRR